MRLANVPMAALPGTVAPEDSWGDMPPRLPLCTGQPQPMAPNGTCLAGCVACKGPSALNTAPTYCCESQAPGGAFLAALKSVPRMAATAAAAALGGGNASANRSRLPATVAAAFYGDAAPTPTPVPKYDDAALDFLERRNCPFGTPDSGAQCRTGGCMVCNKTDAPADGMEVRCCNSNDPASATCPATSRCITPCPFTSMFGDKGCMYCPGRDPYSAYVPCNGNETCGIVNRCSAFAGRVVKDNEMNGNGLWQMENSGALPAAAATATATRPVDRDRQMQLQLLMGAQGGRKF